MKIVYGSYDIYHKCVKCGAVHHSHFGKRACCRDCGNTELVDVIGRFIKKYNWLGCTMGDPEFQELPKEGKKQSSRKKG